LQGLAFAMKDAEPVIARAKAERRRFRRVRVDLPGRLFIPADGREARCTVQDISPGGAAIRCELAPEAGAAVVVYVDGFGRFEGAVARPGGVTPFGVAFHCTPSKRERTAEQLTLINSSTSPWWTRACCAAMSVPASRASPSSPAPTARSCSAR